MMKNPKPLSAYQMRALNKIVSICKDAYSEYWDIPSLLIEEAILSAIEDTPAPVMQETVFQKIRGLAEESIKAGIDAEFDVMKDELNSARRQNDG